MILPEGRPAESDLEKAYFPRAPLSLAVASEISSPPLRLCFQQARPDDFEAMFQSPSWFTLTLDFFLIDVFPVTDSEHEDIIPQNSKDYS